ncbi:unnamed protein product [Candida verbasci]|uniref:Uncharacterized protein n=1 Tax=Candida verbasci TaxID=1227364 RepID=A0A9W4TZG7_9ASCO|nr:unnamed protein product [Candida verbasci]
MLKKPILIGLILLTTIITLIEVLYLSFNDIYYELISPNFHLDPKVSEIWWNKIFNEIIHNNTKSYVDKKKLDVALMSQTVLKKLPKWIPKTLYKENSKGFVIYGDSWLTYLNILQLRKMGSKLPIEYMSVNHNEEFCQEISKYNARCGKIELSKEIYATWQLNDDIYKSLAISQSTFHHLIYLSANSFLLKSPDKIFKSPLYLKNHFITWSSFENKDSINSTYYNLLGSLPSLKSLVNFSKYPLNTKVDSSKDLKYYLIMDEKFGMNLNSDHMIINKEKNGKNLYTSLYLNLLKLAINSNNLLAINSNNLYGISNLITNKKLYQVKAVPKLKDGVGQLFKDPIIDYELYTENSKIEGELRDINKLIHTMNTNENPNFIFNLKSNLNPIDLKNDFTKFNVQFDVNNQRTDLLKFHLNTMKDVFCSKNNLSPLFPIFINKDHHKIKDACQFIENKIPEM